MSTTKDKSQGPYTVQWSDREAGYVVTGPTEDGTYAMSEGSANVYANQLNAAYQAGQADRDELVKALHPFAQCACSPEGECRCYNCIARDTINRINP